jgi:hypothetical protein
MLSKWNKGKICPLFWQIMALKPKSIIHYLYISKNLVSSWDTGKEISHDVKSRLDVF